VTLSDAVRDDYEFVQILRETHEPSFEVRTAVISLE